MVKKKVIKKERNKGMEGMADILFAYNLEGEREKPRYISQEFQDFGYRLAMDMEDKKNISMYIKLAKTVDRSVLEAARSFVVDAKNVKNKSRLFLWKMKQLKTGGKGKEERGVN